MELSSILDALSETSGGDITKTASVSSNTHSNKLETALDAALSMDKTASYADGSVESPTQDLVKIAQKLADAEQLALVKEAEMYGAAVCDGFVARMGEHEGNGTKVAGLSRGHTADELLVKQAMELGYAQTKSELEKLAQQSFAQGYHDAQSAYSDGHESEKIAAAALQQGYEDTQKIASAAIKEGYAAGREMVKVAAEDRANTGYQHALNILGSLA